MDINSQRFPRVTRYLAELPHGLSSYPQCKTAVAARKDIRSDFPELGHDKTLPAPIKDFFDRESAEPWMPEAVGNSILLMVRDVCFKTDAEFFAWSRRNTERTFQKPVYRVLMYILSPSLALMGGAKRWSAFHLGTELAPGKAVRSDPRMRAELVLTVPPRLFNECLLSIYGHSYVVALEAANGKNARFNVRWIDETHAKYTVSWDA